MPLAAIAFEAFTAHNLPDGMEPNLEAHTTYDPPNFSWPFGTHICVVEVDTETGQTEVLKYVAIDDCGNQINPMIVAGQVHGGIIQGLAQALFEEVVYDPEGNLLSSTLAEYLVPAASDVPSLTTGHTYTPSPTNQLGVKGIGEAGTIGAAPAVINAICACAVPLRCARTSPCRRRRYECGKRSTEVRSDPRSVRLRPCRVGRRGDLASSVSTVKTVFKFTAGGHSLLPMMKLRLAQPSVSSIDIGRLSPTCRTSATDGDHDRDRCADPSRGRGDVRRR